MSQNCTQYFSQGSESEGEEERFLSETCEVLAFGSNSSSQLAMGSTEKLMTATSLAHMANCQVVSERGGWEGSGRVWMGGVDEVGCGGEG